MRFRGRSRETWFDRCQLAEIDRTGLVAAVLEPRTIQYVENGMATITVGRNYGPEDIDVAELHDVFSILESPHLERPGFAE
ncbi:hypothetical protein CV102_08535 [Natronococcus pandeyae]|uniref:Uncharacterized protein n=1 Tax=Natronococcus pandeyae TaxID=2055836 RepID=A0A8J8Q677_9EURY|nr:hypothetical protein CV102_08535 [Natronococcus pandeyae]